MNKCLIAIAAIAISLSVPLESTRAAQHAKHGMLLFGETEVFASHIVYKDPHNFQVVLRLKLDAASMTSYLRERGLHPNDRIIFLLDHLDLEELEKVAAISGTIVRTDLLGNRETIAERAHVDRHDFDILFFEKLPTSLTKEGGK